MQYSITRIKPTLEHIDHQYADTPGEAFRNLISEGQRPEGIYLVRVATPPQGIWSPKEHTALYEIKNSFSRIQSHEV